MADFQLVDPQGWEWDLQSIYSAYMNHFQLHNVPWYDRSWGHLFTNFEAFLAFGWPVIVVTDAWTGRAHIVTRTNSIGAFLKMIKTRFGENLPMVDNMLHVTPFETHTRHLRTVSDSASYKKLHGTSQASMLAAQKIRVRSGDPKWVQELWQRKDKTFMAVAFEWSERNPSSCLEWGYAAVRCGHLDAMGFWPPVPETNYRFASLLTPKILVNNCGVTSKGHFIVAEYVDKVRNKHCPTFPWEYAFGESQVIPKAKLGEIIQATISSLASPDSETVPNQLVLVTHAGGDPDRLADLRVKLPNNVLVIDTAAYERQLFSQGHRGSMVGAHSSKPRQSGTALSLKNTLRSLNADPGCTWHCSGNDAFGTLLALQLLLQPEGTQIPVVRLTKRSASLHPNTGHGHHLTVNTGPGCNVPASRSLSGSTLAPPRPVSAYLEDYEPLAQGLIQQYNGQRRVPGRGGQQNREVETQGSFVKDGAVSAVRSVANLRVQDLAIAASKDSGRVSRRNSLTALVEE